MLSQEGVTLEIGNDMVDVEEDFEYSKNVFMSNDEILKFLNMGDADAGDENEENEEAPEAVMPCEINFDKLRRKMNDILGNGMVFFLVFFNNV